MITIARHYTNARTCGLIQYMYSSNLEDDTIFEGTNNRFKMLVAEIILSNFGQCLKETKCQL